ncbi:hypothetical protein NMG60_11031253 [Bertholletia excelsa]
MDGKGNTKKAVKRARQEQLVEYHSLPGYLKDNEFILGYYRSEWPLKQVFLSIFGIHNETLNIWTHLIGFFIFLSLTIYTAMKLPDVIDVHSFQHLSDMLSKNELHKFRAELIRCLPSLPNFADLHRLRDDVRPNFPSELLSSLTNFHISEMLAKCLPTWLTETNHANDSVLASGDEAPPLVIPQEPITRWPFFAFLGGAMFCLLASSCCHLLSCHSKRLRYVMLGIDYAGIATLIATSFYPPVYYSFMCRPILCYVYLGFITLFGVSTIVFSLFPVFQKPYFRRFRASLFFAMGISGVAPVIHKLALYGDRPEATESTVYEVLMGFFYTLGAIIYVTRVPERWRPGKFDIVFSSHQLFHVLVVAGAYTHYHAGLVYLKWRDMDRC